MSEKKAAGSSYINRFIQPDTIIPDYANPQSLNRYSYTLGNPVRYNDPSGHNADCGFGEECLIGHGNPSDKPSQVPEKYRSEYLREVARKFNVKLPPGYKFVYVKGGSAKHPYMLGVSQFFITDPDNAKNYYPLTLPDGTSANPNVGGAEMDYNVYISSNLFTGTPRNWQNDGSPAAQNPDDVAMGLIHEADHASLEANIRAAIAAGGDSSMDTYAWFKEHEVTIEEHANNAALAAAGDSGRLHPSQDMINFFEGKLPWFYESRPAVPSSLWGSP